LTNIKVDDKNCTGRCE